ncbi:hypothetical protein BJX99DRAFT_259278 [Aspergillus californicus]
MAHSAPPKILAEIGAEKCDVDGVLYEKNYFQLVDQSGTRMAGALRLRDSSQLWDLYFHDPATRPILIEWLNIRKSKYGGVLSKRAYLTLRPHIVNYAFVIHWQRVICNSNQPSIGVSGVEEKMLPPLTCLWFCVRLVRAKPDVFPRSKLDIQPIYLDPYDMAHAFKLLSWIYRMFMGSKIPITKPHVLPVEAPVYVRNPDGEEDVFAPSRSVADLLGMTSVDSIRAMENAEAVGLPKGVNSVAASLRLDVVDDILKGICRGLNAIAQFTVQRPPCDPNDRANLLWHLMEVDGFQETCVLHEATQDPPMDGYPSSDTVDITALFKSTIQESTSVEVVKKDSDGAQKHDLEANDLSILVRAKQVSSTDESLKTSNPRRTAQSPLKGLHILKLGDILSDSTTVEGKIPPCSIVTIELMNPERIRDLHFQRYHDLINELEPKGPQSKSEVTQCTEATPALRSLCMLAFSTKLDTFISRITAQHDLIDRVEHYAQRADRGFALFYANTTMDVTVPAPSNPLLQALYLAMDAPRLRYLLKILYDEGAFDNTTAAKPPCFIVIANWPLVQWVTEMFLYSLYIPFVSERYSMSEDDRNKAFAHFNSPRSRCQILLTNYAFANRSFNKHSRIIILEPPLNMNQLYYSIASVHHVRQVNPQKVWILFQDRTFNRWLEANNTMQALPEIEEKLKVVGSEEGYKWSQMAEMVLSRLLGRSRPFSEFIDYHEEGRKDGEVDSNTQLLALRRNNPRSNFNRRIRITKLAPKPFPRTRWRLPPTTPVKPFLPRRFPVREPEQKKGRLSHVVRLLFGPHAGRRARLRLWNFRHETLPAVRHRAQARLYRAILQRQARRSTTGRLGLTDFLIGRRRRRRGVTSLVGGLLVPSEKAARTAGKAPGGARVLGGSASGTGSSSMSGYGPSSSSSTWGSGFGREPGTRRKKVFEYIKAANDLRQSYAASWTAQRNASRDANDEYLNTPGSFPDVEVARSGNEEMVIFPSYARRLVKSKMAEAERQRRDSTDTIDEYRADSERQEHELPEWSQFDDENAVVAVDVRGWMYAPYRGPMTRKQRLAIALARRLTGIPAPSNNPTDLDGPGQGGAQLPRMTEKREEEMVDTEAQSIMRKVDRGNESGWNEAAEALGEDPLGRIPQRTPTNTSIQSTQSTQSTQMSKDELSIANAHLMERIRPFLSNPMAGMAVTAFFFNDEDSLSKNIMTNESGHFSIRASLPFVPTHVRVLASEDLSAVKEVEVIEPTGVSLISDIDDTVKHSAIASGAKEIFRNVFVRELAELNIEGVTDWYTKLAKLGVDFHYVSNAPWQLYPLLNRYFKMVGLPPGSFHLKQYSGMLQGIFEPTVERKKASLEQILQDFPERKFILVGDSGEADLEVYTDVVLANPGRIIGVFIRDITTTERTAFFEKSIDHLEHTPSRIRSTPDLADHSDSTHNRPSLPPRPSRMVSDPALDAKSAESEDLIDLSDEPVQKAPHEPEKPSNARAPPTIPSKPSSLRSVTNTADLADKPLGTRGPIKRKPAPPLPRRHLAAEADNLSEPVPGRSSPGDRSDVSSQSTNQLPTRTRIGSQDAIETSRASKKPPAPPPPRRSNTGASTHSMQPDTSNATLNRLSPERKPIPPNSSNNTSRSSSPSPYPRPPVSPNILRSPASNPSLNRTNTNNSDNYSPSRASSINSPAPPPPLPNKREELWRRRWERASDILGDRGVVLGSWRVGKDVQDVSLWLVKEALKDAKGEPSPFFSEKGAQKEKENAVHG